MTVLVFREEPEGIEKEVEPRGWLARLGGCWLKLGDLGVGVEVDRMVDRSA